MTNESETDLAARALAAVALRRRCERGDLTLDEYRNRLTALLAAPSTSATSSPDEHTESESGKQAPATGEELTKLQAEAAVLLVIKAATSLVGIVWAAAFLNRGLAAMAASRAVTGSIVLACGTVLLTMVVIIIIHVSRVRAQLTARIHAFAMNT